MVLERRIVDVIVPVLLAAVKTFGQVSPQINIDQSQSKLLNSL